MRERGITKDDLARVVVKNRAHGAHNPDAMYQSPTTAETVLASRLVCEPLHLHMLCSPNEGAAAVVLRRAGDGAERRRPPRRRACCDRTSPAACSARPRRSRGIDDADITPPSTLAADAAYAEAGIGPDDVDVAEVQDTDAARELLGWEELGLCAPGDQAALARGG